jgi:photosystem I P700 chlorophyll a apoprotein A2
MWVSRNLFHIGWNGNYSLWVLNPIATIPIAHGIWDPDFANSSENDYTIVLSSGIYNWLFISGFNSVFQIYNFVIICEFLAVISIPLGKVHNIYNSELLHWLALHKPYISIPLDINVHPLKRFVAYFDLGNLRLNFHTGILIGFLSIAWCGHLVDVAIPIERGMNVYWLNTLRLAIPKALFFPFYTNNWSRYSSEIFTFLGGLKSNTISLYLTDIAHHHIATGILFILASHLYLS